jgi:hypothetical protein
MQGGLVDSAANGRYRSLAEPRMNYAILRPQPITALPPGNLRLVMNIGLPIVTIIFAIVCGAVGCVAEAGQ